jgi:regulatory protein
MQKPGTTYTITEATRKIERYCAYQERCHQEVSGKLEAMHMIPEAIDRIMAHLIENNFLNEERFARNFARGKFHQKKWGKRRIVRELEQRQLSKYNIQAALKEIEAGAYEDTLHELALKRLGQIREKHPLKCKRKLADYLLYRGWEPGLVYKKVQELLK